MLGFPFHPFQTFISIFCNAQIIHLWNVMMGGGREISAAQDRLTELLQWMYRDQPENREIIRLIMSTVGRGGEGDVGQRIRDEILVIQVTAQKAKLMVFCHLIEAFVALLLHGVKFSDLLQIHGMQRNNDCAGGMMEEWHQKLHNNTSPDDVVICQVHTTRLICNLSSANVVP